MKSLLDRAAIAALVFAFSASPGAAQSEDRVSAMEIARHLFDRPAGTTIGAEQRKRLTDFIGSRQQSQLGEFGYLVALDRYLDRDMIGAIESLDEFFEGQSTVAIDEHRTMLGRVYLNAVATESRKEAPDPVALGRWTERMVTMYPDDAMLLRIVGTILPRLTAPAEFRMAFARGVIASARTTAAKDALMAGLYVSGKDSSSPRAPADAVASRAVATTPDASVDTPAPPIEVARTLDGKPFDLATLRGKVVMLDFFATWCAPCRAALPRVRALAEQHGDDLRLVGVSRFYGRGMDFTDPTVELPHGGTMKNDIDESTEFAINTTFAERFGIDYPVVFTTAECMASAYGVRGIPTVIVIGRDGRIVGRAVGSSDAAERSLRELVARAVAQ
ncbi:MAG: TlpA family protein disulfide reductase [Planctomycetota bacterium]